MLCSSALAQILRGNPSRPDRKDPVSGPPPEQRALADRLKLEVGSAGSPGDREIQLELVDSYWAAGSPKSSGHLLNRLLQFKDMKGKALARILDRVLSSGDLKVISNLYATCRSIPDPDPDLLKSLARASGRVGQTQMAADQWARLVNIDALTDRDWRELSRFIVRNQEFRVLQEALLPLGNTRERFCERTPPVQFCLLSSILRVNRKKARAYIEGTPLKDLEDIDLLFEFAVLGFRLGVYPFASRAMDRIRSLGGESETVESLEVAVRLFGGDNADDRFSQTVRVSPSVHRSLVKEGFSTPPTSSSMGRVHALSARSHRLVLARGLSPPYLDAEALRTPVVATFSVLSKAPHNPDPWEILADTDLSVPHLMLQRFGSQTRIHAFVSSGRREEKVAWEPARSEVGILPDSDRTPVAVGDPHLPQEDENPDWTQALNEISELFPEDFSNDEER